MDNIRGTIKGYEIGERLGGGGFGVVYRAYQPLLERDVAIKIILPEHANQPDFIRGFEAEAHLVARLEHPHIVPLFDYWRDPEGAYLVMRWVRGGSLVDMVKNGAVDVERVAKWLDQLSGALFMAHRAGVIHRDIKPDNILYDSDDNVYLTDFGIARRIDQDRVDSGENISGSIAYISPDALRGEPISPQSDIYSMGVLLWELLVGKHPFAGNTPSQLIMAHLSQPMPDLTNELPALPATLNRVIQTATAKQASERYSDMRELASAFRGAITPQTVTVTSPEIDPALIFNPYKGLRAFGEVDAVDFYGRTSLIERLMARLAETRFLAVVGASGAGKSSMVQAGLLPALRDGALPQSENWYIVTIAPGEHPVEKLADALISIANVPSNKIREQLLAGDERALDWLVTNLVGNSELLLVIDQFEEVFTLVQDETERVRFLTLLAVATQAHESRLRVVLTLRADFMDRPLQYPEFGELLRQHIEYVIPMTASELEQAITAPALQAGLLVDGNLVAQMVVDVQSEPGALPLLQYALYEVCEQRDGRVMTLSAYQGLGGIGGALAKRADDVYTALTDDQQRVAQQALLRFVTLGEGAEDTRRRTYIRELTETTPDKHALQHVFDVFGTARLLTFDTETGTREPLVEVAHEALIRTWERLREWLNANRDDIRLERQLALATDEWQKSQRDASYLLTGSRLAQFEAWQDQATISLTPKEKEFLRLSIAEREEKRRMDEERKAHEAQTERRSQLFLRGLVAVLAIATLGGFVLSGVAVTRGNEAIDARTTSDANVIVAQNAGATSDANVVLADNARGTSDANVIIANDARSTSDANLLQSERSRLVSAGSVLLPGDTTDPELAALLAIRSLKLGYSDEAYSLLQQSTPLLYNERVFEASSAVQTSGISLIRDGQGICYALSDTILECADTQSGEPLFAWQLPQNEILINMGKDSPYFVTTNLDSGTVVIRDKETGTVIQNIATSFDVQAIYVTLSGDRRYITISAFEYTEIWDIHQNQRLLVLIAELGKTFSADGQWLAYGDVADFNLNLRKIPTGETLTFRGHTSWVFPGAFSSDGKYVLSGSSDASAILWDIASQEVVKRFVGHAGDVGYAEFSSDDASAFTQGGDGIRMWDVITGQESRYFSIAPLRRFDLTSNELYAVDEFNWIVALNADLNSAPQFYKSGGDQVGYIHFTDTGFITSTQIIRQWDQANNTYIDIPNDYSGLVAKSPQKNDWLAYSADANTYIIFNPVTLKVIKTLDNPIYCADYSLDGSLLVTASLFGDITLWDTNDYRQIAILDKISLGGECQITFSPDGKTIAFTSIQYDSSDSPVSFYDTDTRTKLSDYALTEGGARSLAWSEDSAYVVTGQLSTDDLYFLSPSGLIKQFKSLGWSLRSVAFIPNSTRFITTHTDGMISIWDADTQTVLQSFPNGSVPLSLAIDPDGKRFLVGDQSGNVKEWYVDYRDQIVATCGHLYQDLTAEQRLQYGISNDEPTCPTGTMLQPFTQHANPVMLEEIIASVGYQPPSVPVGSVYPDVLKVNDQTPILFEGLQANTDYEVVWTVDGTPYDYGQTTFTATNKGIIPLFWRYAAFDPVGTFLVQVMQDGKVIGEVSFTHLPPEAEATATP